MPHKQQATPHTYREDTRRKALRRVFLGRDSIPIGLDKDDPTVTVVATTVANEHNGTYEIPNR
jgi:hypothetical protein